VIVATDHTFELRLWNRKAMVPGEDADLKNPTSLSKVSWLTKLNQINNT
jgi:hypothetical protein